VADRLPRTFAALAAGHLHPVRVRIIEDETQILSPEDAAAPGCGRPAARCDLNHTIAWHAGGVTCECNIAPTWL
jgi:hypothetical protein